MRHCTARWQPPQVAAAPQHSSECSKFPFNNVLSRNLPTTILPGWSERAAQRTADHSAPAAGTTAAALAPPAWRGSLPRGYRATAGWLRCLRHGRRMIRPGRRWRGRLLRQSPKTLAVVPTGLRNAITDFTAPRTQDGRICMQRVPVQCAAEHATRKHPCWCAGQLGTCCSCGTHLPHRRC